MANKRIMIFGAIGIATSILVCYILSVLVGTYWSESVGSCAIVDGSRLRVFNSEIFVTNALSINVRPTQKTSEWIYVYGTDPEICINRHRLNVSETQILHVGEEGKRSEEVIKCESPVLLRFFKDEVIVAGVKTWTEGQIVIENTNSLYEVTICTKKGCRIVVKGNWYEYTG